MSAGESPATTQVSAPPEAPPQALGTGARGAQLGSLAIAGVLALGTAVAFRSLIGFDPASAPNHDHLQGVESLLFSPSGSSPVLVFSGAAWLIARRARKIRASLGAPGRPLLAVPLLALAAAGCLWAYYVDHVVLLVPALSLAMLGSALWLGGFGALRAVLLPALFLWFAVPLPPALINQFMYGLQVATASSAAWGLSLVGFDVTSHADLMFHGSKIFQVIESCSGLRTVETLFMSSFLYHDLFFRSRLHSTLVVLSSLAIGFLVNWLRVIGIVLNPYSHFGTVHETQGLVMIVVGVLLLAVVDRALARWLPARPWWRRPRTVPALPQRRMLLLAVAMLLLAVASWRVQPWKPVAEPAASLSSFPPRFDGWQASGRKLDRDFFGSVGFSEWVHRSYRRGDESVDLLLGSNRRLDPRVDFASVKLAIPGPGWAIVERGRASLRSGRTVERLVVESPRRERQLVYWWTEGVGSPLQEIVRAIGAVDRSPWRRPGTALAVRVATPIVGPEGVAEQRLLSFAALVEEHLPDRPEIP